MKPNVSSPSLILFATALVIAAALSRLLPHPHNFTPIGGMALFAGAVFSQQRFSWVIPFAALWISDLILNNTLYASLYEGFRWYGDAGALLGFATVLLLGRTTIRKMDPRKIAVLSLVSSVLFFLVSNLTYWLSPLGPYTMDVTGLLACYTAALPFFGGTVAGDFFFNAVLFGGWYLINQRQTRLATV